MENQAKLSRRSLYSWALFDWANSAFASIIQTFVFAVYFTNVVATNPVEGGSQWGFINSIAALIVAILCPILGAIADQGGNRKPWIGFFAYLCIITTALLWFVIPGGIYIGSILVCLGIVGSEAAFIFYSAMLRDVAGEKNIGKWSGMGWGFGYFGGMCSLIIALIGFVSPEYRLFELDAATFEPVRATFLLSAAWYFVFSLPLFFWTIDPIKQSKSIKDAVSLGLKQFIKSFINIKSQKNTFRFLLARMLFIDGLTTLFAFGGIYAATVFGMNAIEILKFGILLNVTAGIGSFLFAYVDDWIGSKKLILITLIGLIILSATILFISDYRMFWILGAMIGTLVGPVQSASRSYMARTLDLHLQNQMFGYFAFSGKATAFLGPLLVGWLIYLSGSMRVGMSIICLFFILGWILMLKVEDDKV